MDRISLYIFRHLVVATVVAVAILVFAIWLTQSLRLIEIIVDGSAPFHIFLRMVLTTVPNFLVVVMPIGLVCAVLFTYNRMLTDTEMVVMRAVGISPAGLARPALMLATIIAAIIFCLNLYVLPLANQHNRRLQDLIKAEYSTVFLREGQFNEVSDDITVYFRERLNNGELNGILIHDNRDSDKPVTMIAARGVMAQTETGPRVLMFDGNRQEFSRDPGTINVLYFEQYALSLEVLREDRGQPWRKAKERFLPDLLYPNLEDPQDRMFETRLISIGHQRLSSPLLAFAFAAIALGALLSGDFNRRGQGLRIVFALAAVIAVQALDFAGTTLTRQSVAFVPMLYATPTLTFAAGMAAMYLRAPRPARRRQPATV